jgi:hypothetical protein
MKNGIDTGFPHAKPADASPVIPRESGARQVYHKDHQEHKAERQAGNAPSSLRALCALGGEYSLPPCRQPQQSNMAQPVARLIKRYWPVLALSGRI